MENKLPSLNHAVATFWAEIKAQGLADNVVVVQGSEFGRTITPNSNTGSDHAWVRCAIVMHFVPSFSALYSPLR